MIILCFGTFSRLLRLTTTSFASKSFEKMATELLKSLMEHPNPDYNEGFKIRRNGNDEDYFGESITKLIKCNGNIIPEIKGMLQAKDLSDTKEYLKQQLFPTRDRDQMKLVLSCLKKLVAGDSNISSDTSFSGILTKQQLLSRESFTVDEFFNVLTGILCYCIIIAENSKGKAIYKKINKDFIESCRVDANSIGIYERDSSNIDTSDVESEGLTTTSDRSSFEEAFTHIHTFSPTGIDISQVKIFCHPFDEKDFDYEKLNECLLENIGNYVFSRSKVQESFSGNKMKTLAHKAIMAIKHLYSNKNELAQEVEKMLVYLALEQAFEAPKLFVSTEMKELSHQYNSVSSGVHIKSRTDPWPALQLVFSTAIIEGNLESAIESSLEQMSIIANNKKVEKRKVEENIMNLRLFDENNEMLEKILLANGDATVGLETAFGGLIGYTTSSIGRIGKSTAQYQAEKVDSIKNEIVSMEDFISATIRSKGLEEYSVYFFFIPFDKAEIDRMNIVEELLC